MASYHIGDVVRVEGTLTDVDGVAVDPATVTVKVRPPTGATVTYTYAGGQVTRSALGVYFVDVSTTEAGRWTYQFLSTGTGQAMNERYFTVSQRAIS